MYLFLLKAGLRQTALCICISDFFRGPEVKQIRLAGLEHAILVSAIDGKILIRNYRYY